MGMGREWDYGNKTRLNLGLGMGITDWEWEGMGLKKIFPLISNTDCMLVSLRRPFCSLVTAFLKSR